MAIGESLPRIDALAKVRGEAVYPADVQLDDCLFAKVVFSGKPHARLRSIDTEAAKASPGVIAVLTAADVPCNEYGLVIRDQPVLVGPGENSLWEADRVAVIVAQSEALATRAAAKLETTWQELPVLADVESAERSELALHPRSAVEGNIYRRYKLRKGDMDAGWAAAHVTVEATYEVPLQEHAYLQPEAGVAYVDDVGRITVETAGQWAHEDRMQIAHALGLSEDRVRVIYRAIGGAFGGREDISLQIVLALTAYRLHALGVRRPVRCVWSREESIVGHHKRHAGSIHTRWGADRSGRVTAVEADIVLDAGAYAYTSDAVLRNVQLFVSGPYDIANLRVDSRAVFTNNVPGGAFRGFGAPQACFAAEGQMNRLAVELGMDPVELRANNCFREDSAGPTQAALPPGVSIARVVESAARAAAAPAVRTATAPTSFATLPPDLSAIRRGRGFACAYKNVGYSFGFSDRCEASIELRGGATIEHALVRHAAADVGQGSHTVLRQMAAAALDLPIEQVELSGCDTSEAGDSGSASASRLTFMAGNAIREAAARAFARWESGDRPATGSVRFEPRATTPMAEDNGACVPNFAYGYVAESVDLSVDIETGHICIDRVVCAVDVGRAINPQLIVGQIEGAVAQAYGYAVTEELRTVGGRIVNPRLSGYSIPRVADMPNEIRSVIEESADPRGPWGVRGMAEMPGIPLAPAIAAALHDATGVRMDTLPFTPKRVLRALADAAPHKTGRS